MPAKIQRPASFYQTSYLILALFCFLLNAGCRGPFQQGVIYHPKKPLLYKKDQFGNHIPDYSTAGYRAGGVPLPRIPEKVTLHPLQGSADDTKRIQAAIDRVSSLAPDPRGFRGAILLQAGRYRVDGQILLRTSGVVLRGSGQYSGGSEIWSGETPIQSLILLSGRDAPQDDFNAAGRGGRFLYRNSSDQAWEVVDLYAPSGRDYVQVAPVGGLAVGETVILEQRMNREWVRLLGMDNFPARPDKKPVPQWNPADFVFHFERRINKIAGGRVYFESPLVNPIFAQFGSTRLFKPILPNRITNCGVENLRLVASSGALEGEAPESPSRNGVTVTRAKDCWVKGVTSVHYANTCVELDREALRITVEDCAFLDPVAQEGYGRRHGFISAGQQLLFQRCFTRGAQYPFFVPGKTGGPNVFLDCYAEGFKSVIGPWRHWAMGTLWDNTHGGRLMVRNRGYEGMGWGWSGINHLFWNCNAADTVSIQSPVNGWNWAIGCRGKRLGAPFQGLVAHYSHHGERAKPRSLYMRQLEDRLHPEAGKAVFSENQRQGTTLFYLQDTLSQ